MSKKKLKNFESLPLFPSDSCLLILSLPYDTFQATCTGSFKERLLYFPGRTQSVPQVLQCHAGLCCCRLSPHSVPIPPPPAWVSQSPLISCYFNPVLSEQRTDALRPPTRRGRAKSKAEPQELCKQRREREISPSSLRRSGLNLHNQLDVPWISGIPE